MRHIFMGSIVAAALVATGCAVERDEGQESSPQQNSESKEYQFEIPGEIQENETVFVTSGDKTYECRRMNQADGQSKVQCAEPGLALHRDKG